ncbi:MAG TPA: homoserine dehydrogenase, partial [Terriglobales bacterium]|nr:homoserine dehydrogenase [Terriglobales bacterium]
MSTLPASSQATPAIPQPKLELVRDIATQAHSVSVAILGFGTVGRSVAEILSYSSDSRLRLTHVFNRDVDRKRVSWANDEVLWTDKIEDVLDSDVDLVVETVGGLDPAYDWVRKALLKGKSVVTANKQLIAHRGRELTRLAFDTGQQLLFGASVAGGVPVLLALQEGLAGDRLVGISGILNGTCNYILTRMEQAGVSFEAALAEAQQFGYAEADPSADVNGNDATAKLAILVQVALKVGLTPSAIRTTPVTEVNSLDFLYARDLGCTIRQISRAQFDGRRLFSSVEPALVPRESSLAQVQGNQNVVIASGKYGGNTAFLGSGAGGHPTAVAVISDLIAAAHGRTHQGWLVAGDSKPVRSS